MIISNSDIQSFQKCEMRFFYERILELRPRNYPPAMEVGTFGHKMMEEGFTVILNGGTYEEAVEAVSKLLLDQMQHPERMAVFRHVIAFIAWFQEQPWRVVGIEEKGNFKIDDDKEFGFTPDLIIEWTAGPLKGQLEILDYKFTGQAWTDAEIDMSQQLPKYLIYKNKRDGTNIHRCGIVQLFTRAAQEKKGSQLFLVKHKVPSKHRLQEIERENEILMDRVRPHFENPDQSKLMHTVDAKQCKMCWFASDLCPMDMDGKDTTNVKARNYIKNDYGYNKDTIEVKGTGNAFG